MSSYNKLLIFIIPILLIPLTNLLPSIFAVTFEDYVNNEKGFEIRYPNDWEIREHVDPGAVYFVPLPPNDLKSGVIITKSSLDYPNMTLEDIKNQFLQNNTASPFGSTTVIDVNDKDYSLGGYPAIRIEGTMDPGFVKQKVIVFVAIVDDSSYGFMASSDITNFDNYAHIFQGMLSSFRIIKNQDPLTPEMFLNKLLSPSTVNASALGNEQSKITIVEFADYQCPFCAQFHKETRDSIIENFVDTGKAKFLYKDLIVNDGSDKASTLAAAASYCAAEQGMYWEYHDELFKNSKGDNTGWVTKDNLQQFAKNVRVPDLMKFSDCVDTGKYNEIVTENDEFARNIGLQSTPSFIFYNGTTPVAIQGAQPYEAFDQIITAISANDDTSTSQVCRGYPCD